MGERAAEAVQADHHDHIAGLDQGEQLVEARAGRERPGGRLGEHPLRLDPGGGELVDLVVEVLLGRTLDAPVMLHGKLTDTSGTALAGAQVLLAAWPSNDTLHALPVGSRFDITPVARTVAGPDGAYELRSLLGPLLNALTTEDGLDVELDIFHGGRHFVYLSQVVPDRERGAWVRQVLADPLGQAPSTRANSRNALDVALDRDAGQQLGRDLLGLIPPR